ncbi:MAG TPA: preprotein translocase subunit SecY [Steroidobacteraceae bacterium]|nr:preprotein translocase subunit SecY [Steroidobacteraceae bacterium]
MASSSQNPASVLGDAARFGDVRKRLLFLIGGLIVYRIGTYIPVPGIDPERVAGFFRDNAETIFGIVNMFSGGALERLSIFTMGVMPYISASIIVQMMAMVVPQWMEYRKEGESGRRKLTEITRYGTLGLALFQSFITANGLQQQGMVVAPGWQFLFVATITMTTGAMFLMWLGEQITERGVGNGISMIILGGIVAGIPGAIGQTVDQINTGEMSGVIAIALILMVLGVTTFCVFVERAQRRIPVDYAKRQVGRRMYAGQTTHLPFKLNMSGVIPPIFASSLLLFPATIAGFAGQNTESWWGNALATFSATFGYGQPAHITAYAFLIIFFCFFYTALVFNARETADNLKKSGAFIRGIRPGQQTGEYIDKVLTRLTLWGAVYITAVCLLPEILVSRGGVPFVFGGTSLLIVVVVAMDFFSQLQAHLMSHHYPGLLKKANLMGYGRSGAPQS